MAGPLPRRALLRLGGVATLSSLAGCATLQAELGLRSETLGRVALANSIDEPFEVDVEVARDGTTVHASSHHLAPGSPDERRQVVLHDWEEDPDARAWEIRARTRAGDWRTAEIDAAVGTRDDCHGVTIVTGDWPETSVLVLVGDCGDT